MSVSVLNCHGLIGRKILVRFYVLRGSGIFVKVKAHKHMDKKKIMYISPVIF
jgi:hypothetical protein